jgi:hypothetical protein
MTRPDTHDDNPLSHEEKAILSVFASLGVPAEQSVPTDIISARIMRGGFLTGAAPWLWESAFISLQVRGLVEPGPDPFSAISWRLTPEGHALVHSASS